MLTVLFVIPLAITGRSTRPPTQRDSPLARSPATKSLVSTSFPSLFFLLFSLRSSLLFSLSSFQLAIADRYTGGLDLVQSHSILRHVARKYGFNGSNEKETSKI